MAFHPSNSKASLRQDIYTGPALDRLPEEIIQQIIKELGDDLEVLSNLRLTCMSLEYSTRDRFLKIVFWKSDPKFPLKFTGLIWFGTRDLGNWAVALKRPQIAEHFDYLCICTHPKNNMKEMANHLKEQKDGKDVKILADVLRNFKSLLGVVIGNPFVEHGQENYFTAQHSEPAEIKAIQECVSHTTTVVLSALSKIHRRNCNSFFVYPSLYGGNTITPGIWALELPPDVLWALKHRTLRQRKCVHLCLSNGEGGDALMNWTQDRAANSLIKFLNALPGLVALSLSPAENSIFGPKIVKKFLQEYHCSYLYTFRLRDIAIPDSKDLLNLLDKHRSTLKKIHFEHIHLYRDDWKIIFQKMCEEMHLDGITLKRLFVLQQNAYWSITFPWRENRFSIEILYGYRYSRDNAAAIVRDELRRATNEYESTEMRYGDSIPRDYMLYSQYSKKILRYANEIFGFVSTHGTA